MTTLAERLRTRGDDKFIRDAPLMREAADEIERLRAEFELFREAPSKLEVMQYEIQRLRAVIMRAKDALLDGQSTQWVHDLLVAALLGPKPALRPHQEAAIKGMVAEAQRLKLP